MMRNEGRGTAVVGAVWWPGNRNGSSGLGIIGLEVRARHTHLKVELECPFHSFIVICRTNPVCRSAVLVGHQRAWASEVCSASGAHYRLKSSESEKFVGNQGPSCI